MQSRKACVGTMFTRKEHSHVCFWTWSSSNRKQSHRVGNNNNNNKKSRNRSSNVCPDNTQKQKAAHRKISQKPTMIDSWIPRGPMLGFPARCLVFIILRKPWFKDQVWFNEFHCQLSRRPGSHRRVHSPCLVRLWGHTRRPPFPVWSDIVNSFSIFFPLWETSMEV